MKDYFITNIDELLNNSTEQDLQTFLLTYENNLNKDIDKFLKHKAINFSKQGLAKTYLVIVLCNDNPIIVGYFSLANKGFYVNTTEKTLSNKMRSKLSRFVYTEKGIQQALVPAPLIAQIGKNTLYPDLILGDDLIALACNKVKEAQNIISGKFVYLECEDNPKLLQFYQRNNFTVFKQRKLDSDEEDDFKEKHLLQLIKFLK